MPANTRQQRPLRRDGAVILHSLLRPNVVLPCIAGVGVLVALFGATGAGAAGGLVRSLQPAYLLPFLALTVVGVAIRCAQWSVLLRPLDACLPARARVFTLLASEFTRALPMGDYFRNYLLHRMHGTDMGLSSAATTVVVVIGVAVSFVGLLILGIAGWMWLRPAIALTAMVLAALVWLLDRAVRVKRLPQWLSAHRRIWAIMDEAAQLRRGFILLLHARVLVIAVLCGAVYMTLAGSGFYLIARSVGALGVSYPQALAVYLFIFAVNMLCPIPVDIGVQEVSGVGALATLGVALPTAVGVMLIYRVPSTGVPMLIALGSMIPLRDQLWTAMGTRGATRDQDPLRPGPGARSRMDATAL